MQLNHGLLPGARLASRVAAPLRLRLDAHRVHVLNAHAEDLLDGLAHLRLVRLVVDAERVLVGGEERVALLADDRADDHAARIHQEASPPFALRPSPFAVASAVSASSAAGVTTSRAAPMTSATPTASAGTIDTSRR